MATQAPATQIPAYSYPQATYPQTAQAPSYPQTVQVPSYSISPNTTFATHGYSTYPSVAQQPALPTPPAPTHGESMPAPTPPAPERSMATPGSELGQWNRARRCRRQRLRQHRLPDRERVQRLRPGELRLHRLRHRGRVRTARAAATCGSAALYWLFMERDNPNTQKLTVRVDHNTATDPYYPQANTTVLDTDQTDYDFRRGVEVRFGSTFSIGSDCDEGCGNGYGYAGHVRCRLWLPAG